MAIKCIITFAFIILSQETFAQIQLGKYLDSLMKHAPLDPTPKPQKSDTINIQSEKNPPYKRDTSRWDRYRYRMIDDYYSDKAGFDRNPYIGDFYFFKKAPPRKNRIFLNFPLRIDRTVLSRWE